MVLSHLKGYWNLLGNPWNRDRAIVARRKRFFVQVEDVLCGWCRRRWVFSVRRWRRLQCVVTSYSAPNVRRDTQLAGLIDRCCSEPKLSVLLVHELHPSIMSISITLHGIGDRGPGDVTDASMDSRWRRHHHRCRHHHFGGFFKLSGVVLLSLLLLVPTSLASPASPGSAPPSHRSGVVRRPLLSVRSRSAVASPPSSSSAAAATAAASSVSASFMRRARTRTQTRTARVCPSYENLDAGSRAYLAPVVFEGKARSKSDVLSAGLYRVTFDVVTVLKGGDVTTPNTQVRLEFLSPHATDWRGKPLVKPTPLTVATAALRTNTVTTTATTNATKASLSPRKSQALVKKRKRPSTDSKARACVVEADVKPGRRYMVFANSYGPNNFTAVGAPLVHTKRTLKEARSILCHRCGKFLSFFCFFLFFLSFQQTKGNKNALLVHNNFGAFANVMHAAFNSLAVT